MTAGREFKDIATERPDAIQKSIYGLVSGLDVFFEAFTFIREHRVPVARHDTAGSFGRVEFKLETERVPGFYFMSSEDPRIKTWIAKPVGGGSLHVKVKEDVLHRVAFQCIDGVGGFKIIPWHAYGVALVVCTDRAMIANPWLGFVPLASLPEIDHTTVGVWGETSAAPQ